MLRASAGAQSCWLTKDVAEKGSDFCCGHFYRERQLWGNCGKGLSDTVVSFLRQLQEAGHEKFHPGRTPNRNRSEGHLVMEVLARGRGEIMGFTVFQKPLFHSPFGRNYIGS